MIKIEKFPQARGRLLGEGEFSKRERLKKYGRCQHSRAWTNKLLPLPLSLMLKISKNPGNPDDMITSFRSPLELEERKKRNRFCSRHHHHLWF